MSRVLVVDDEEPLRASLTFSLSREGYQVACAADGASALESVERRPPDLIILDVMLPGLDGMQLCRRLRATSDVPIIMLTARAQERDRIQGLETGADDYITKPFSTRELLARMKSVLRRREAAQRILAEDRALLERMEDIARWYAEGGERPRIADETSRAAPGVLDPFRPAAGPALATTGILTSGTISMDLDRHEAMLRGQSIPLAPKEFQLLRALLSNPGCVLTREQLIQTVWGDEFTGDQKTLDVHIRWLREKLEDDPSAPKNIVTVRGVGYRLE
jgi:two-component system response regulator RegX3